MRRAPYSNEVQQRPLTAARTHRRQHTKLAGTTAKRPAVLLVRDEEAAGSNPATPTSSEGICPSQIDQVGGVDVTDPSASYMDWIKACSFASIRSGAVMAEFVGSRRTSEPSWRITRTTPYGDPRGLTPRRATRAFTSEAGMKVVRNN